MAIMRERDWAVSGKKHCALKIDLFHSKKYCIRFKWCQEEFCRVEELEGKGKQEIIDSVRLLNASRMGHQTEL